MSQQIIIDYWVEKAGEDLASARDNLKSGRYQNAVRDAYFACFHAFSAVLLNEGIMIKVTATKFRNNLFGYLDKVAKGETKRLRYNAINRKWRV
jgi:uncharacterized protein (UPF0332 family)